MAEGGGDEKAGGGAPPAFISYASQDAAVAGALVETLELHGIACWIAPRDVKAGALYADAIVRAISGAKAFVLVLSESAIASSHVSKEIERASSKKRPIIALRIDAAPLTPALEYFLSESQWVEAQAGNIDAAYVKLIDAIREPTRATPEPRVSVVAETSAGPASEAHSKSRRNWTLLTVGLAVVATLAALMVDKFWLSNRLTAGQRSATSSVSDKSIAVLPFVDMSEKHDQEYFSDGLSEELIDLLTKVPDLRVPARTSSFFFKGKSEDIAAIAQKLRVAHVLEGSVRKASNTIRVTAQLIRADNGYHVWSETYDRDLKDVFKVQDEIAGAVVSALKLKLVPGQQASKSHRTTNPEAHNEYLLGLQIMDRLNPNDVPRAVEAFRKATELDPGYAAAYAWLAASEFGVADDTGDIAGMQQALATAEKAVELDPDEANAYAARGYLRLKFSWDWNGAQADLEKGLILEPGNSTLMGTYAALLRTLGRFREAIAASKKATELDPLSNDAWTSLGQYLLENRQFGPAHDALRHALELQPESGQPMNLLGELQLLEGKSTEALATFRQVNIGGFRLSGVAMAEHTLGHAKQSQQALDELIAKYGRGFAYEVATVYAWRAEKDKAFEWLERCYQLRVSDLVYIKDDPLLSSLVSDPRYKAFLRTMNLPE